MSLMEMGMGECGRKRRRLLRDVVKWCVGSKNVGTQNLICTRRLFVQFLSDVRSDLPTRACGIFVSSLRSPLYEVSVTFGPVLCAARNCENLLVCCYAHILSSVLDVALSTRLKRFRWMD